MDFWTVNTEGMAAPALSETSCCFYCRLWFQLAESKGRIFTLTYKESHRELCSSVFLRGVGVSCVILVLPSSQQLAWFYLGRWGLNSPGANWKASLALLRIILHIFTSYGFRKLSLSPPYPKGSSNNSVLERRNLKSNDSPVSPGLTSLKWNTCLCTTVSLLPVAEYCGTVQLEHRE